MSEKILVPLDGSTLAEAVQPYVEGIARALNLEVVLMRVVEHEPAYRPPTEPLVEGSMAHYSTEPVVEAGEAQRVQAEEAAAFDSLAPMEERLRGAGLTVTREVAAGRPRDIICGRAHASDIALLLMCSHGRTGLARLFRGSVAEGVIKDVRRPAVVVRPFRDEQARVDLEHAELLPADRAAALRAAMAALQHA